MHSHAETEEECVFDKSDGEPWVMELPAPVSAFLSWQGSRLAAGNKCRTARSL